MFEAAEKSKNTEKSKRRQRRVWQFIAAAAVVLVVLLLVGALWFMKTFTVCCAIDPKLLATMTAQAEARLLELTVTAVPPTGR